MIKLTDDKIANELYSQIKQIILEKQKNSSYNYESSQYLANRDVEDEIKKRYISEKGKVTYENINGDLVTLKICRWHNYLRWSRYGIYEIPNFKVEIYIGNKLIWNLTSYCKDSFNGEYSETEVSSLDFPETILQERKSNLQESNDKQIDEETEEMKNKDIISQETKILFNEIKSLSDSYKTTEQQNQELLEKREKDIENSRKKIINSYSKKITSNKNILVSIKKELNTFDELLLKYSTFNLDLIGSILEQLISITESEEYLYKQVSHTFKKRVHGVIDSWDEDIKSIVNIIISKNKLLDDYDGTNQCEIDKYIENGNALLLFEQDIDSKKDRQITFYTLNDGYIESRINFGKFDYAKGFIENIIQYRFQNNLDKISEKDMLLFLQNYIIQHKDKILKKRESKFNLKLMNLKHKN